MTSRMGTVALDLARCLGQIHTFTLKFVFSCALLAEKQFQGCGCCRMCKLLKNIVEGILFCSLWGREYQTVDGSGLPPSSNKKMHESGSFSFIIGLRNKDIRVSFFLGPLRCQKYRHINTYMDSNR